MPTDVRMDRIFLRALRYSLVATRGGIMRARVLKALLAHPLNPLALAKVLAIDYKTATHHLDKLQKQGLVVKHGTGYGATYAPTFTPEQKAAFEHVASELGEGL